jgi:phosphate transport system permease protein
VIVEGRREHAVDRASRYALALVAAFVAVAFAAVFGVLLSHSLDAWKHSGWSLVTSSTWDPVSGTYGAWPYVFGTLFTSILALVLALPVGIAVALFLTELAPRWLRSPLGILVELLAGVPSIVYGFWGIAVLAPLLRKPVEPWLANVVGTFLSGGVAWASWWPGLAWFVHWIPFAGPVIAQWMGMLFTGPKIGIGFLLAGLVLAVMILPTIVAISRDAILAVPRLEREAAYALGATRWEVARGALRSAKAGVFAAGTLGLGRALGETMAVYLVIANVATQAPRLFAPGQTLASAIANQLGEASDPLFVSSLLALGLILFVLTLLVNIAARLVIEPPWKVRT